MLVYSILESTYLAEKTARNHKSSQLIIILLSLNNVLQISCLVTFGWHLDVIWRSKALHYLGYLYGHIWSVSSKKVKSYHSHTFLMLRNNSNNNKSLPITYAYTYFSQNRICFKLLASRAKEPWSFKVTKSFFQKCQVIS